MNWITMAIRLVPFVIKMVGIVEKLFDDGEGANKKKLVMEMVEGALEAIVGISTGEQKELWTKLEPTISSIIDALAGFLFPHDDEVKV